MPTAISHAAAPIAVALAAGKRIPFPLALGGLIVSTIPDLDVIAFKLGIPYANAFGHRGFSHSLVFAAGIALIGATCFKLARLPFVTSLWFLLIASISHPILDAFTSGGLGVELFWPFSEARFFAPIRPIRVAPISIAKMFSARGVAVLLSEAKWIWLPCAVIAGLVIARRKIASRR